MFEKRWKEVIPSSKGERDVMSEIWGYAGCWYRSKVPRKHRGEG